MGVTLAHGSPFDLGRRQPKGKILFPTVSPIIPPNVSVFLTVYALSISAAGTQHYG